MTSALPATTNTANIPHGTFNLDPHGIHPANPLAHTNEASNLDTLDSSPSPQTATPGGYPQLSAFVNSSPSHTFQLFRRFGMLNARCLLYLQDEICEMENELALIDASTYHSDTRRYDSHPTRHELIRQITAKITEYS